MTIGIDFDGTIVKEVEFPSKKMTPLPYAISSIKKLAKMGHHLVLCSARYGWYRELVKDFLNAHKLPIQYFSMRLKPECDIYIDNRNLGCEKIDWKEIVKKIELIDTEDKN